MHWPTEISNLCFHKSGKTRIDLQRFVLSENTLNEQFVVFVVLSDIGSMTENCSKNLFCSWVFMNDIVDATVIWVESDSWRWGHGLENWQIFGFPVLIVKLFFSSPSAAFFSIAGCPRMKCKQAKDKHCRVNKQSPESQHECQHYLGQNVQIFLAQNVQILSKPFNHSKWLIWFGRRKYIFSKTLKDTTHDFFFLFDIGGKQIQMFKNLPAGKMETKREGLT